MYGLANLVMFERKEVVVTSPPRPLAIGLDDDEEEEEAEERTGR